MNKRLAWVVAIGALAGVALPGMTVGQEPTDSDGPVIFEWSVTPSADGHEGTIEATDPRASGALTLGTGEALVTDDALLASFAVRLANEDGAWTGTGRAYGGGDDQDVSSWELTGEGSYEGLSLFTFDGAGADEPWGMIVASDAIPPYPDVPAE